MEEMYRPFVVFVYSNGPVQLVMRPVAMKKEWESIVPVELLREGDLIEAEIKEEMEEKELIELIPDVITAYLDSDQVTWDILTEFCDATDYAKGDLFPVKGGAYLSERLYEIISATESSEIFTCAEGWFTERKVYGRSKGRKQTEQ